MEVGAGKRYMGLKWQLNLQFDLNLPAHKLLIYLCLLHVFHLWQLKERIYVNG